MGCEEGVLGYQFVSLYMNSFHYLIQFQVSNAISKLVSQLSSGNSSLSAGLSFKFALHKASQGYANKIRIPSPSLCLSQLLLLYYFMSFL